MFSLIHFVRVGELLARSDFNDVYGCVRVQQMIQMNIFCCIQSFWQLANFGCEGKKRNEKKRKEHLKYWDCVDACLVGRTVDMCVHFVTCIKFNVRAKRWWRRQEEWSLNWILMWFVTFFVCAYFFLYLPLIGFRTLIAVIWLYGGYMQT